MAGTRWRDSGGIVGLFEILAEHGYTVETDLRRYYGVDLLGFWRDELTARQVLVMLYHLPAESASAALVRETPELQDWGLNQYLLGSAVDRLGELVYAFLQVHVDDKEKKNIKPYPSVLPDSAVEKVVRDEVEQMSVKEFFSPADIFAEIASKK